MLLLRHVTFTKDSIARVSLWKCRFFFRINVMQKMPKRQLLKLDFRNYLQVEVQVPLRLYDFKSN